MGVYILPISSLYPLYMLCVSVWELGFLPITAPEGISRLTPPFR
jgi:hypothetical protein